mmetsp:Transcript_37023/g.78965  ORF Transcript_37023/g.78965 Transcript_37023/m.78965 type:complete len:149 (-) Transcript_37023:530-976(-)
MPLPVLLPLRDSGWRRCIDCTPPRNTGKALPPRLTLQTSLTIKPSGNIAPALAFGSQCHMAAASNGFNQKHKLLERSKVRVTLMCRESSPSPPPGEEYKHRSNAREITVATSAVDMMVEWAGLDNAILAQLGWWMHDVESLSDPSPHG